MHEAASSTELAMPSVQARSAGTSAASSAPGLQERLAVRPAQVRQRLERPAVADGGQHVGQFAVLGAGVVDVVGRHDRQAELPGQLRGLGDQPVVVRAEVVRELDEEAAAGRPVASPEDRRVPLRDRSCPGPIAHPQATDQLPVAAPGQGDQALGVLRQERLAEARHALRPGHVRLRDEPAQAPPAHLGSGQQDEMGPATSLADPAQVLLDRLAMAGQPGTLGSRPDGEALGHVRRGGTGAAPRSPGTSRPPRPARADHTLVRVRHGRVQQLDLEADDRMQPHGLRRTHEPDRAVQPRVVRDGQAGQAELDGPCHEVVGRGRPIEEREVGVAVELGVRDGCHGSLRSDRLIGGQPV